MPLKQTSMNAWFVRACSYQRVCFITCFDVWPWRKYLLARVVTVLGQ